MGKLDEYRAKRDFTATPEPAGGDAGSGGLSYVIQKHAASRLHWDFRLELDGVLLSWAVPKGPSLSSADKRLAVHVEDHPVEYGAFEGTIPQGEYGGGTVMLWDRGTWRPDHGDPRAHLAEGHLKFELFGERLRGRWMLVRTKGYGGAQDSWLLFKERDAEERPAGEFDATAEWMTSVATGRTMEEIASGAPSRGEEPTRAPVDADAIAGALRAPMPRTVDVQLCTLVREPPEGERWLHEIKFDGYRIVAFKEGDSVRLVSRNHKDWTARFPGIAGAVAGLSVPTAILDGEVVVVRPDGTTSFQELQNHARSGGVANVRYQVFDLLYLDGTDLRGAALLDRKRALEGLMAGVEPPLHYTDHIEGHGDVIFSQSCDLSLEGVVSKRRDGAYRSGRGHDWLKIKCLLEQEFVVVGYTDPTGGRMGFGALVLAVHDGGALREAGRVGTGFTDASLTDIHERLEGLQRETPPVVDPPQGADALGIHWVEPELVAEVAFAEWTADGRLRHPSFKGLREDKPAGEVVAERADAAPEPVERDVASAGTARFAGVVITSADRVIWPDTGVTKLELCRYYEMVADLMLPHVAHRPLSLVRCPDGIDSACFYQKRIKHFPGSVGTVDIYVPGDDVTVPYAQVKDLSGLIGLVQMNVLEIHPWGSRADDPDKPDRIVFDLDPDEDLPWKAVATTALLLRSELGRLGLQCWVKSTGGKGLHVVVPVTRRHEWGEVHGFARAFADRIVSLAPDRFTTNMSKARRVGRIFIDHMRNARGATAIAPYCVRSRPGAPVAVPLHWEELADAAERPVFTVRTLGDRLATLESDPWEGMGRARQSITRDVRAGLGQLDV